MKKYSPITTLILVISIGLAFVPTSSITVYMIGDSTMSIKQAKAYPETGWGNGISKIFQRKGDDKRFGA